MSTQGDCKPAWSGANEYLRLLMLMPRDTWLCLGSQTWKERWRWKGLLEERHPARRVNCLAVIYVSLQLFWFCAEEERLNQGTTLLRDFQPPQL